MNTKIYTLTHPDSGEVVTARKPFLSRYLNNGWMVQPETPANKKTVSAKKKAANSKKEAKK